MDENRYVCNGEASLIDDCNIEITELPIKTWTQNYKESVLEPMVLGTEKTPPQIVEYREYNTDTTVRFQVKVSPGKLRDIEAKGLHKFFSIQSSLTYNNTLVAFDQYGALKKYDSTLDILKDFCQLRSKKYVERKDFILGMLTAEVKRLENQARFITEKIDGVISIFNKKKKDLIKLLLDRGYDSDPVKAWKESLNRDIADTGSKNKDDDEEEETDKNADFNYILNMPLWSLSRERKDDLLNKRDAKRKELEELTMKTPNQLWIDDLDKFEEELSRVEAKEKEEEAESIKPKKKAMKGGIKARVNKVMETMPSPRGIRIEPKIDTALFEKKGPKRPKKEKKADPTVRKLDDFFGSDDTTKNEVKEKKKVKAEPQKEKDPDEFVSLSDRLKMSAEKRKKTKQSKLTFKPKPKKDPWESSDEDDAVSDKGGDLDDIDWDEEALKYDFDESEDEILAIKEKKNTERLATFDVHLNFITVLQSGMVL